MQCGQKKKRANEKSDDSMSLISSQVVCLSSWEP